MRISPVMNTTSRLQNVNFEGRKKDQKQLAQTMKNASVAAMMVMAACAQEPAAPVDPNDPKSPDFLKTHIVYGEDDHIIGIPRWEKDPLAYSIPGYADTLKASNIPHAAMDSLVNRIIALNIDTKMTKGEFLSRFNYFDNYNQQEVYARLNTKKTNADVAHYELTYINPESPEGLRETKGTLEVSVNEAVKGLKLVLTTPYMMTPETTFLVGNQRWYNYGGYMPAIEYRTVPTANGKSVQVVDISMGEDASHWTVDNIDIKKVNRDPEMQ